MNAPASLDGTTVRIGGQAAFIDYVSPGQVNAQVPSNVGTGSQPITVTTGAGTSATYTVTVNQVQPGLLASPSFNVGGRQYVVALFPDGVTYVLPPGLIAGVPSRRARPGDTITLYGVGFGPVTPNIPAGQVVAQSNTLASPLQISLGQTRATVPFAGLASGNIGLYQFNVVVPEVAAGDAVPLTFTVGGSVGRCYIRLFRIEHWRWTWRRPTRRMKKPTKRMVVPKFATEAEEAEWWCKKPPSP